MFSSAVPDSTPDFTLLPIIIEKVTPGTTIITDQWRSYCGLEQHFQQMTVNHSLNFVDPETFTHTSSIENT